MKKGYKKETIMLHQQQQKYIYFLFSFGRGVHTVADVGTEELVFVVVV